MTDILTADEVASTLRISRSKVYELTQERDRSGGLRDNPLPCFRLGSAVRFHRAQVESWLQTLATEKRK